MFGGKADYSTNSGSNWVMTTFPSQTWTGFAATAGFGVVDTIYAVSLGYLENSSTEAVLIKSAYNASTGGLIPIQIQQDTGQYGGLGWNTMCCPASDGNHLAIGGFQSKTAFYSSDGGSTLHSSTINGTASPIYWSTMASSWSGNLMLLAGNDGFNPMLYSSTDEGATWNQEPNCPPANINGLVSSADGTTWIAATDAGIYKSIDSAATWVLDGAPVQRWSCVAASTDGNHLFAGAGSGVIYMWTPTNSIVTAPQPPTLIHTPVGKYSKWSWPSFYGGNFVLQQSTNLNSPTWQNVSWPVVTNGGQYQVMVPQAGGRAFFRLKTP